MKRLLPALPLVLLLSGCAQIFDGNLFTGVDAPPPLKASDLASKSPSTIEDLVTKDPSFLDALKGNDAALKAVQDVLSPSFTGATLATAVAGTDDQKAAVVDAAQSYVMATAFGTGAGDVVNEAIKQAPSLISGGSTATVVQDLLAGKTEAEITTLLTQFTLMNTALNAMQQVAAASGAVDDKVFWGSSNDKGDLAQVALVAAAVSALVGVNTDVATLAARLAPGGSGLVTTGGPTSTITHLNEALDGTDVNPASNPYAYLSAVTGIVNI